MAVPPDALVAGAFYTFGALAIIGAIGIIAARRLFHSALFLVLMLMSVAAEFVVLGADFLAVAQALIYVGAVMVLILFGIMLTPQQQDVPSLGGLGQQLAGVIVAGLVFTAAVGALVLTPWPRMVTEPINAPTTATIGQGLFTTFALPFEVASVLLLVAMIGAIVIAREDGAE